MASVKNKQLAAKIHAIVSEVITNEVRNELANQASVVEVQLTNDNSIATVFVNFYNEREESFFELLKARPYIKRALASSLDTRKCPDLIFKLDNALEEVMKLEKVFQQIKKEEE